MRIKTFLPILVLCTLITGLFVSCATTNRSEMYSQIYEEKPVSILIMPPINQSTNVEAKDYFYTTLAEPLCNEGYYVFPTFLSLYTLQRESAYNSELFIERDISKFGEKFGADVLLFTIIKSWNKSALFATVEIEVEYILKSTKTNQILFDKTAKVTYDTSVKVEGGILASLVSAIATTVNTALTDYIPIARECNDLVIKDEIPYGPYHPMYLQDGEIEALGNYVQATISN